MTGRLFLDYFPARGLMFCHPVGTGFVFLWGSYVLGADDTFDMLTALYDAQC